MIKRRHAIIGTAALTVVPPVAIAKVKKPGIRISTKEDDPGYPMWVKYRSDYWVDVFVDGKPIKDASTVDTGEGLVIAATHDADGYIVYDRRSSSFPEVTYRGDVTIALRPNGFKRALFDDSFTYENDTPLPMFSFKEIP